MGTRYLLVFALGLPVGACSGATSDFSAAAGATAGAEAPAAVTAGGSSVADEAPPGEGGTAGAAGGGGAVAGGGAGEQGSAGAGSAGAAGGGAVAGSGAGEQGSAGAGSAGAAGAAGAGTAGESMHSMEVWASCSIDSVDASLVRTERDKLCASTGTCEPTLEEQRASVVVFAEGAGCGRVTIRQESGAGPSTLQYDADTGELLSARVPYAGAPWLVCASGDGGVQWPEGGAYVVGEVEPACDSATWCSHSGAEPSFPECAD